MSDALLSSPVERLILIIEALRRDLGKFVPRPGKPGLPDALLVLIWNRLSRLITRINRVAARIEAGLPPSPPRKRASRPQQPGQPPSDPPPPDPPPLRLPRGRGWLVRLMGYHAAGRGSQLLHLLAQPEMAPLLADPRMGRLLRPLCHMLLVDPPPEIATPRRSTAPSPPPGPDAAPALPVVSSQAGPPSPRPTPPPQPAPNPSACGPPPLTA